MAPTPAVTCAMPFTFHCYSVHSKNEMRNRRMRKKRRRKKKKKKKKKKRNNIINNKNIPCPFAGFEPASVEPRYTLALTLVSRCF